MVRDNEVDAAYPQRWIGSVDVTTTDGRTLSGRIDEPRGDPGNTLSRSEVEEKAIRLADWSKAATPAEMRAIAQRIFSLADAPKVGLLLRSTTNANAEAA
jgi:2-methylcitrate dehydratase PrpD